MPESRGRRSSHSILEDVEGSEKQYGEEGVRLRQDRVIQFAEDSDEI